MWGWPICKLSLYFTPSSSFSSRWCRHHHPRHRSNARRVKLPTRPHRRIVDTIELGSLRDRSGLPRRHYLLVHPVQLPAHRLHSFAPLRRLRHRLPRRRPPLRVDRAPTLGHSARVDVFCYLRLCLRKCCRLGLLRVRFLSRSGFASAPADLFPPPGSTLVRKQVSRRHLGYSELVSSKELSRYAPIPAELGDSVLTLQFVDLAGGALVLGCTSSWCLAGYYVAVLIQFFFAVQTQRKGLTVFRPVHLYPLRDDPALRVLPRPSVPHADGPSRFLPPSVGHGNPVIVDPSLTYLSAVPATSPTSSRRSLGGSSCSGSCSLKSFLFIG